MDATSTSTESPTLQLDTTNSTQLLHAVEGLDRRTRRSSEPLIAIHLLFRTLRLRHGVEGASLIDDHGLELATAGDVHGDAQHGDAQHGDAQQDDVTTHHGAPLVTRRCAIALPGRRMSGLLIVRGPADTIEPAMNDARTALARILR